MYILFYWVRLSVGLIGKVLSRVWRNGEFLVSLGRFLDTFLDSWDIREIKLAKG